MMTKKPVPISFVTDKNIFDALNEHKVNAETIADLFEQRNTIVSSSTPRAWLADYFSRLTHDFYDHKKIAERLGVTARRERITSVDVYGIEASKNIKTALDVIKDKLEQAGDVVNISATGGNFSVLISYEKVDYGRSEFNQIQARDGLIEFHETAEGYVVRSTQNPYINDVRDMVLQQIAKDASGEIRKDLVSLFAFTDPKVRTEFFFDLFNDLPGFPLQDVTDIHVFKKDSDSDNPDDLEDSFVERVTLRGRGVTRSTYMAELGSDDYYVIKVAWRAKPIMSGGEEYDLEAVFADPKDCTGFSYIVLGVHDVRDGVVQSHRRLPLKSETAIVSRIIEQHARTIIRKLSTAATPQPEEA